MPVIFKKYFTALFAVVCILAMSPGVLYAQTDVNYIWPVRDSDRYGRYMNSAFAEYRPDRFHAGIDIKTIWREGHKVVAVENGSLYRLRISPTGYGRAVYLRLKDGNIAVYAHLRYFEQKFQELAETEQEKTNRYTVDVWYSPGAVPVNKGEILGTTGRSGTRLQHLHFELRDRNNVPVNPLSHGFAADDEQPPRPTKISFRPMNIESTVEGDWQPYILRLNNYRNGAYNIEKPVKVRGEIGIAVDVYDRNGTYDNNFGIYSLQLKVDGIEKFRAYYDRFDYSENRLINLDRDYRLMRRDKGRFQKLYRDQKSSLSFYGDYTVGDGIFTQREKNSGTVTFEVVIADYSGNKSYVRGELDFQEYTPQVSFPDNTNSISITGADSAGIADDRPLSKPEYPFSVIEDYQDNYLRLKITAGRNLLAPPEILLQSSSGPGKTVHAKPVSRRSFVSVLPLAEFENTAYSLSIQGESSGNRYMSTVPVEIYRIPQNGLEFRMISNAATITFPEDGLYSDIWLRSSFGGDSLAYGTYEIESAVIRLEPKEIFLKSNARVTLNYPGTEVQPEKLAIYAQSGDGRWHFIGQTIDTVNRSVSTNLSSLETIALIRDTIPPDIWRVSPRHESRIVSKNPEISAWFEDEMSGIEGEEDIEMLVDGAKVIAEWDPILRKIFFVPGSALNAGMHTVEFTARDRMGNTAVRTWNFLVQ